MRCAKCKSKIRYFVACTAKSKSKQNMSALIVVM